MCPKRSWGLSSPVFLFLFSFCSLLLPDRNFRFRAIAAIFRDAMDSKVNPVTAH